MSTINYSEIDPGVRRLVRWLNGLGYETTDSGDGVSKGDTMECAFDVPNVAIRSCRATLLSDADSLRHDLLSVGGLPHPDPGDGKRAIQASYDPADESCIILLLGVSDVDLPVGVGEES